MRIVVTGGAGFIGSGIARHLVARGDEVIVFDDLSNGSKAAIPAGAELVEGDIRDLSSLNKAIKGAEVVFHEAALRSVPRSLDEPSLVHQVNATGTLNVLLASQTSGVRRVVYASSSSVYGGASEGISTEEMAPNPMSPYAVSKLTGEYYCRVWGSLGRVETVSLRYFNVFGPGQHADSKYAAVFPAFVRSVARGEAAEVHWDGEQSRDFTYIDDVVQANILAAESQLATTDAVVNIAGGASRTIVEVLRSIGNELGRAAEPRFVDKRPGDIRHSRGDIRRAQQLLGWQPTASWGQSVRETTRWFTEHALDVSC